MDKGEDPLNVRPFWDMELKFHTRKPEKIPSETTINEIYDRQEVNGQLLILGEPGSGKTTTLLQLAKLLIKRCEQDIKQPIPILFNLSSWTNDNQSIHDWIIESLKADPYGIKKELSKKWLEEEVILPLLDGLDELYSSRQKLCIDRLNEYLGSKRLGLPLVICSRLQEFENNQTPLNLNACIILQALREEQIKDYITKTEGIVLWEEIKKDSDLLELSKIPFFLSIIVITCEEISFIKWQKLPSDLARRQYLFKTYVNKMLARKHQIKVYTEIKTKKWLGWLAVQLINESKTEFLIENIQPYWLTLKHEKLIYRVILGLIGGLIGGLIIGLIEWLIYVLIYALMFALIFGVNFELNFGLMFALTKGLNFGLIGGLILGLIGGLIEKLGHIQTIETIQINLFKNREKLIKKLIVGMILGLIGGLILGLIEGLIGGLIIGLIGGLIIGLIGGLIGGLIIGLIEGLIGAELNIKTYPNQGIQESIKNAFKISLINVIILTVIFFPILEFITPLISNIFNLHGIGRPLSFLLILLMTLSILSSILPALQHLSLRITISLKNYAPWNYAQFLNYTTDKLFLQRVGGRYRFIHRILQEYFAQMYSKNS